MLPAPAGPAKHLRPTTATTLAAITRTRRAQDPEGAGKLRMRELVSQTTQPPDAVRAASTIAAVTVARSSSSMTYGGIA